MPTWATEAMTALRPTAGDRRGARLTGVLMLAALASLLLVPQLTRAGTEARTTMCLGKRATMVGNAANNVIKGTVRNDVIVSLGGDDVIYSGAGHDRICAGDGRDRLFGGPGNDLLSGGPEGDDLIGAGGRDTLDGGGGVDLCTTGEKKKDCELRARE